MDKVRIRSDWTGRVLDGIFPLHQWLGGSSEGEVFLTELTGDSPRKAVVKVIPVEGSEAEACLAAWAASSGLVHPHLLRVLRTGQCRMDGINLVYAVTDYADEVLAEILPERPLTPAEVREMLGPVLDALAYLHGNGFVHGRIKPSNILVVKDQLKISADRLLATGSAGKSKIAPSIYDAPETAGGEVTPAADLWSLGVTLVEALTQQTPAWDPSANQDPVVPSSIQEPLAGIARECLRTDPKLRSDLRGIEARLAPGRTSPMAGNKGTEKKEKLPTKLLIVAVFMVFAAVAGVFLYNRRTNSATEAPSPDTAQTTEQQTPQTAEPASQQAPEQEQPTAAPVAAPVTAPTPPSPTPGQIRPAEETANDAVLEQVLPKVPEKAGSTIEGKINLAIRVTVDANGAVTQAEPESDRASKYFARLATEAARKWKFKPSASGGQWLLRFQFTRAGVAIVSFVPAR